MNFFAFDPKKVILIIFTFAIPLISLSMIQDPSATPWFLRPFTIAAGYSQMGYSSFSSGVRSTVSLYLDLIDIKKNNRELKQNLANLNAQLSELQELKAENQRLNHALGFKTQSKLNLATARVISHDLLEGNYSTIQVDRGTEHGVKTGQAVITPEGVVGSVLDAQPHFSKILVLNDRYAVIDARIQRTRARGLVEGKSEDTCQLQLKYLERGDDVQIGDVVVTTGLDEIFPRGFPIGKVTFVEKKPYGITQYVELEPIIDPFRLEEVFIVLDSIIEPQPEETAKETKTE
jgi:rod shape-determining protein MreC